MPAARSSRARGASCASSPIRPALGCSSTVARFRGPRRSRPLTVSRDEGALGGYRMLLAEGATGKVVRSTIVTPQADNALLRHAVCDVLGETCEVSRGIPWYVWPLAGAVVLGGVITTAVILENNRD